MAETEHKLAPGLAPAEIVPGLRLWLGSSDNPGTIRADVDPDALADWLAGHIEAARAGRNLVEREHPTYVAVAYGGLGLIGGRAHLCRREDRPNGLVSYRVETEGPAGVIARQAAELNERANPA